MITDTTHEGYNTATNTLHEGLYMPDNTAEYIENQYQNIPQELKNLKQWVCFEVIPVIDEKTGESKLKKTPKNPHNNSNAKVNDPKTWGSYENAVLSCKRNGYSNIAFCLTENDPYCAIDIDHCVSNGGSLNDVAQKILNQFSGTYSEYSTSKTGIHFILKGKIPKNGNKESKLGLELYQSDRFIICTGDSISPFPICELQKEANALYDEYFKREERVIERPQVTPLSLSDSELLDKARASETGIDFSALYDHGDLSKHSGDASKADFALCKFLAYWTQGSFDHIDRLFISSKLYRDKWDRQDYKKNTMEGAIKACTKFYDPNFKSNPKSKTPNRKGNPDMQAVQQENLSLDGISFENHDQKKLRHIEIVAGNMHIMTDNAEQVLCENNSGIYQRGGQLVRIVTEKTKPNKFKNTGKEENKIIKRADNSLLIAEADPVHLCETIGRFSKWERYDKRSDELQIKDCPERVAKTLVSRKEWGLPVLVGIIQAPTLRPDGSILETQGYDEETGLFFNAGQTLFLPIPQNPTKDDAIEAKNKILFILDGFPFENEESRSVALSAILTGLMRKSLRTAPLHGFTAPTMGTGKSLLADVTGLIATGKTNCVIPHAENEAEEKKRLLAVLSEGDPIICYDNIERPFGSPALCSVLSQTEYKDRLLGANRSLTVPTNATFLATGNNLTFIGDISTRVILCRLDSKEERPEERSFDTNLYQYIPQNRGEIVQAALTILRAYHVAGRPKQRVEQFGRFEEWSDFIRSAIVWVEMEDPCKTRKEVESEDPVRLVLGNLLSTWYEALGDMSYTIKDAVNKAKNEKKELLLEALIEIAPDVRNGSKDINTKSLGKKLSSFKDRPEKGYRFEKMPPYQGCDTWRVVKILKK